MCGRNELLLCPREFHVQSGLSIAAIRAEFPEIQIILGLSNVSFGLNPAARAVLNSVFLDHAVRAGMTGAIVHVSKIRPLHVIAPEEVKVAEDLIFDRRSEGYDPLHKLMELFAGYLGPPGFPDSGQFRLEAPNRDASTFLS